MSSLLCLQATRAAVAQISMFVAQLLLRCLMERKWTEWNGRRRVARSSLVGARRHNNGYYFYYDEKYSTPAAVWEEEVREFDGQEALC